MKTTAILLITCLSALAQGPSVEVGPDRTVTFRIKAPQAKEVFVNREGAPRAAMQKGEDGTWTLTTAALEPDYYGYTFNVDGVGVIDATNPVMKPNLLSTTSMFLVPGGQVWEVADVPHGTVHHHFFKSAVCGDERDYFVYTPPGYDPTAKTLYPVMYLFHGYSDDASGWTAVGKAHVILDNLIARKKAKPMIIVMTLGYGTMEMVSRTPSGGFRDPNLRQKSFDRFRDSVLTEVMPAVEKSYRVTKDRAQRAIAGLSMGGAETLYVGLNALDRFAYVGAFSSGGLGGDMPAQFPKLDAAANAKLKLFWISCGVDDRLIDSNRKYVEFFNGKGVTVKLREGPGAHTWMVWRRNLAEFASMLF